MEPQASQSQLQQDIVAFLDTKGVSQRKFGELTGVSETTYGTYRRMKSIMGLDVLEKIILAYPEVKEIISKYLGVTGEENITHEANTGEPAVTSADRQMHLDDLRAEIRHLRHVNNVQAEAILNFSRKLGIPQK